MSILGVCEIVAIFHFSTKSDINFLFEKYSFIESDGSAFIMTCIRHAQRDVQVLSLSPSY